VIYRGPRVSDYVFQSAESPSEPTEFWLEVERSYLLRAELLARSAGLDAISLSLIADAVFELQELEFAYQGEPHAEVSEDDLRRVQALNAELMGWLER
jgi:hypothetical protein